jgi:hypothetical protein
VRLTSGFLCALFLKSLEPQPNEQVRLYEQIWDK